MQWKHALIVSAALFFATVAIWPRTEQPAYGNDNRHGASCVHYTIDFPETDDEEIARIYAATHIVTMYLEGRDTRSYNHGMLADLIKQVKVALK
ncbi:MAG: hypothetical protein AAGB26_08405 [Planctomycetota bacterium]